MDLLIHSHTDVHIYIYIYIYIYTHTHIHVKVSKVGDHIQGLPESSLLNSSYTDV